MPDECVVDTSCLIVLDKIELLYLLCQLYKRVYIPEGVATEFGKAPLVSCAETISVRSRLIAILTEELNLGLGEAETIAYSYEHGIRAVIDDAKARRVAKRMAIKVTGTIGLLMRAEKEGIVASSYDIALKLREVGFYLSDSVLEGLRKRL